jgi:putative ATPase
MKGLGYGEGYKYAHSFEEGRAEDMECLPEGLRGRKYYSRNPRDKSGK